MKKIFTLFFLLPFLHATSLYSQHKMAYERWHNVQEPGGLCTTTIVLCKDSTYCLEHGCEESSFFSFGKWKQKQNNITFIPANPARFKPISKVETSTTNDSTLTVVVYDKEGNNITDNVTATLHLRDNRRVSMDLDSTETKRTCLKEVNSTIILESLQKILNQKIQISTGNATIIHIFLNTPAHWNFHINSESNAYTFTLIKNKDKLITFYPDHFDRETGEFVPSEFIKLKNQ